MWCKSLLVLNPYEAVFGKRMTDSLSGADQFVFGECMKDYKDLVTRLRKAAVEEPVERRQLLLRAASAIDELRKESSESVKLLDDYASSARVIALYLKQFCDTSLNYPNMIADAARKACEALEKYQKSKQEGRLVVLPCRMDATVYDIRRFYKGSKVVRQEVVSGEIDHFTIGEARKPIATVCLQGNEWADYEPDDLILTREEAEAALEGGKDG